MLYDSYINGFILDGNLFDRYENINLVADIAVVCGNKLLTVGIDYGVSRMPVIKDLIHFTG